LAEGLDVFRLRAVAVGEDDPIRQNLSFAKELWLDGCLGVEPRKVGIALAEGLCY
jgi:hypothetical protein